MMGDDWATTKWAFNSSGHPLDYRYKLVGEAMVKQFAEMERFVYVCLGGRASNGSHLIFMMFPFN